MFTSDAVAAIQAAFGWIGSIINFQPIGLNITLWQLALGMFLFRVVWRLALSLVNTSVGVGYHSTSYYGKGKSKEWYDSKETFNHWKSSDTNWHSEW